MQLAPIILFVYNRPGHTKKSIQALAKNILASESELYIYADGAKESISNEQYKNVKEVREYIKHTKGFKAVHIAENETNLGLANSIIKGVTEVINAHGKAIVLEDDIVTGEGFLNYMNEALNMYADEDKVGCIHGWNYHLKNNGYANSTFFLKGADCWGWATWQRAWKLFNKNGNELLNKIIAEKKEYDFDRRGTHDFVNMLKDQINGKNDSWAVRWHASLFLENRYCLHPVQSLVKNIGLDAGVHCNNIFIEQQLTDHIQLNKISIEESTWFFKAYKQYQQNKTGKWLRLKTSLKQLLPR